MTYRILPDGRWQSPRGGQPDATLHVLVDPNVGMVLLHGLGLHALVQGQRMQDALPWETRLVALDLPALSAQQAEALLRALETADGGAAILALPHRPCTGRALCLRARDATPCLDAEGRPLTSLRVRPDALAGQDWLAVRLPGHPALPSGEFLWRGRVVRHADAPTPVLEGEILDPSPPEAPMTQHALVAPRPGAPDPLFLPDLGTAFCRILRDRLPEGDLLDAAAAVADRDEETATGPFAGWETDPDLAAALEDALAALAEAEVPADAWDWLSPRLAAFRARTRSFPGDLPGMEAWEAEMARMQAAIDAARAGRRDADGLALLGRRLPTLWS